MEIMLHTLCGCTRIMNADMPDGRPFPYFRVPIKRPYSPFNSSPFEPRGIQVGDRMFQLDERSGGMYKMPHYFEMWEE